MTFKIAIVGPESTGKTSLAQKLSLHYHAERVAEHAVEYLDNLNRDYSQHDLIEIARGQIISEDEALAPKPKILICDTNLVVIKIWSDYKYGFSDPKVIDMMTSRNYDIHILTKPDLPWEPSEYRENPDDLEELFELYYNELMTQKVRFEVITGVGEERIRQAVKLIDNLLIE